MLGEIDHLTASERARRESERLQALDQYGVFDTPPDDDLDRIVQLAARICKAPVAALSLVGRDRLYFKSHYGIEWTGCEREQTFCDCAIESDDILCVLDAGADERFRAHPMVTEAPHVRFYAGVPLTAPSGHRIGTVCILDVKPWAEFKAEDRKALDDVAALVMNRLEMRRAHLTGQRGIRYDLAAAREAEQRLFELAEIDPLTGLPNRTRLLTALRTAAGTGCGALLQLDLAGFKDVNDTIGHALGDVLLRQAGERLQRMAVGAGNAARIGGDEFALLLPTMTDEQAETFAEKVVAAFAMPFTIGGESVHLGANIGIVTFPAHGTDAEELAANASVALQRSKQTGAPGFRIFTPRLRQVVIARRTLEAELRQALAASQFELRFQPQMRLADRKVIGAEALLRWRHPTRGLLSPAAFLPALEASPFAAAVGDWVLDEAGAQAAEWRIANPGFRIAVNLFGAQFDTGDLVHRVEKALLDNNLPANALELEITENIMLRGDQATVIPLREICAWGVNIAFDDYGTGFASLSLLKRFPVTRLKIDRAFVSDICRNEEDAAIVQAIIYLGRCFKLGIIAEGIECETQEEALRLYGCTEGQGYFYAEPLAAAALTRMLGGEPQRTVA